MKAEYAQYIQDIAFNDNCDRMVIATTSRKIIIYKKVKKSSDELILTTSVMKKETNINNICLDDFIDSESDSDPLSGDESNNKKGKDKRKYGGNRPFSDKNKFFYKYGNPLNQKSKEFEYPWEKIGFRIMDGPILRIQWASVEFGNIFACSGYNKWIYIFQEEEEIENKKNKITWNTTLIKAFSDSVVDISFLPIKESLHIASVTSDGFLRISKKLNSGNIWDTNTYNEPKNNFTCLCCNPSDPLIIVIGCKKNIEENIKADLKLKKQENNKILNKKDHLIQLAYFKTSEPKWQSINEYGHEDDITDVDWANRNGRTYHMICSTSKDGKFIIWEISLLDEEKNNNFASCKIIHEFKHSKPLWRCCFNDTGIFASCIDEDGNTFIFLKVSKDKFVPLEKEKIK